MARLEGAVVHRRDLWRARELVEHVGQRADDAFALLIQFARGRPAVGGAQEGVIADAEAADCTRTHCVAAYVRTD